MAWIVSVLNLANTIIGVSVLSMPFLLQNVSPLRHRSRWVGLWFAQTERPIRSGYVSRCIVLILDYFNLTHNLIYTPPHTYACTPYTHMYPSNNTHSHTRVQCGVALGLLLIWGSGYLTIQSCLMLLKAAHITEKPTYELLGESTRRGG